MNMHYFNENNG